MDIVSLEGISKRYGSTVALDAVSVAIRQGEIRGLVGENGAGKSTLAKILSGDIDWDRGKYRFGGEDVLDLDPSLARAHGISIVHQWGNIAPNLTIQENIFLGHELTGFGGFVNGPFMKEKSKELLNRLGFSLDPSTPAHVITASEQQVVAIAKALSYENTRLLIMDEGGVSLDREALGTLFGVLRILRESGVTIFYISHLLDNVISLCDTITVLRNGTLIDTVESESTSVKSLASLMVGSDSPVAVEKQTEKAVHPRVKKLSVKDLGWEQTGSRYSFDLHAGEVLGITGPAGAGKSELIRTIFGLMPSVSGKVVLDGKDIPHRTPEIMVKNGVAFTPEDRFLEGMIYLRSIEENFNFANLWQDRPVLKLNRLKERASNIAKRLAVRMRGIGDSIATLSGGNQQKIVVGRWLDAGYHCFLFDEPYKGIDVGAKREINEVITELARNGAAVIVVSTEFSDITSVVDRLKIMVGRRFVAELLSGQISEQAIMEYYQSVA